MEGAEDTSWLSHVRREGGWNKRRSAETGDRPHPASIAHVCRDEAADTRMRRICTDKNDGMRKLRIRPSQMVVNRIAQDGGRCLVEILGGQMMMDETYPLSRIYTYTHLPIYTFTHPLIHSYTHSRNRTQMMNSTPPGVYSSNLIPSRSSNRATIPHP